MTDTDNPDRPMPTMMARARELGITITVSAARRVTGANYLPADDWDGWEHDRYRVRLAGKEGRTLTTTFRKGTGHNGSPPTLDEVLDALVSDASSADEPFEDWAAQYGYDTDSRKAYATWEACRKVRNDLLRLVGAEALDVLTYHTERL